MNDENEAWLFREKANELFIDAIEKAAAKEHQDPVRRLLERIATGESEPMGFASGVITPDVATQWLALPQQLHETQVELLKARARLRRLEPGKRRRTGLREAMEFHALLKKMGMME